MSHTEYTAFVLAREEAGNLNHDDIDVYFNFTSFQSATVEPSPHDVEERLEASVDQPEPEAVDVEARLEASVEQAEPEAVAPGPPDVEARLEASVEQAEPAAEQEVVVEQVSSTALLVQQVTTPGVEGAEVQEQSTGSTSTPCAKNMKKNKATNKTKKDTLGKDDCKKAKKIIKAFEGYLNVMEGEAFNTYVSEHCKVLVADDLDVGKKIFKVGGFNLGNTNKFVVVSYTIAGFIGEQENDKKFIVLWDDEKKKRNDVVFNVPKISLEYMADQKARSMKNGDIFILQSIVFGAVDHNPMVVKKMFKASYASV